MGEMYIRSMDQIGFDQNQGSGIKMTETEVIEWFGIEGEKEIYNECLEKGSAVICFGKPGKRIKAKREEYGWSIETLADKSDRTVEEILLAEDSKRLSVLTYDAIAKALEINPRTLYDEKPWKLWY
jgi:hypothetical protein